ncbi:MAG: hypothetical protein GF372_10625 [Candidatus Marinimicrobia bacterium]|nr:hypothetical protein [Candidatus Neomarinimicrobiota bacterium]
MRQSVLFFLFLGLITMGLTTCTESEDPTDPNDSGTNTPPNAVISADSEIGTGTVVSLDGTGSSDPDGDDLTFAWILMESPTNSTATLSGATTASAEFTADEVGTYKVSLTVSDGSADDTAEHSMVTEIEVLGNITEDRTLVDVIEDPTLPDYRIESDIDISAVLTIDPGVVIHADEENTIKVVTGGVFIANGTATDSIEITSSNEAGNIHWGGLLVESTDARNKLEYVTLNYGGAADLFWLYGSFNSDLFSTIGIDGGKLSVINSTISNSTEFGLVINSRNDGSLETFSDNRFVDNGASAIMMPADQLNNLDPNTEFAGNVRNSVRVFESTLENGDNQTWQNLNDDATYYVTGDVTVNSELTISSGAEFEFGLDVFLTIGEQGALFANGTDTERIIFTSSNIPGQQYWGGIHILSSDSRNIIEYADVEYGGGFDPFWLYGSYNNDVFANVSLEEDAHLGLQNVRIANSEGAGLVLDDAAVIESFSSNEFVNNTTEAIITRADEVGMLDEATTFTGNGFDVVRVYRSDIDINDDQTWVNLSDPAVYRITGDLTVNAELTINPAAELQFGEDVEFIVTSDGVLDAQGTMGNEIVFTSVNENGGILWGGLLIESNNVNNIMDYTRVSYGGGGDGLFWLYGDVNEDGNTNIGLGDGAKLALTNSEVSYSGKYGLAVLDGATVNGLGQNDATAESDIENNEGNNFNNNTLANVIFEFD